MTLGWGLGCPGVVLAYCGVSTVSTVVDPLACNCVAHCWVLLVIHLHGVSVA